jgi:hypothetical protein
MKLPDTAATRHTFEMTVSSVCELDPRSHDQVGDGARHEHLARPCGAPDPRPDVNGKAAGAFVGKLDLAGMETGSDLQPNGFNAVSDSARASDRPRRTIEDGQETVACRVDLLPSEVMKLGAYDLVMGAQQLAPPAVTLPLGTLGRADDVGEQHRGKDSVYLDWRALTGQELADLLDRRVRGEEEKISSG